MPPSNASLRTHPVLQGVFAKVIPIAREIAEGDDWQSKLSQRLVEEGLDFVASHLANCDCWRLALDGTMAPKFVKLARKTENRRHAQNGVCTCGEKPAKMTSAIAGQEPDRKPPAKAVSDNNEPTHRYTEIQTLTQDHQWHVFFKDHEDHRQALALRPDGRTLCMSVSQYLGAKEREPEHLEALIAGTATQGKERNTIEYEEQCSFSRCDDCGRFCFARRMHKKEQEQEQDPTQIKDPKQHRSEHEGKNNTGTIEAEPSIEYCNTRAVLRIDPPCYCRPCSNELWSPEGFLLIDPDVNVASLVKEWVGTIERSLQTMRQILQSYEHTLRRRWKKKKPSQREAILKRASYGTLMTYRYSAELLDDFWPRKKSGRKLAAGESGQCALGFLLEDVVKDCDVLFDHLMARSRDHPSKFFLVDMIRTRNVFSLTRHCLRYCPGSFSIREESYGVWETWDDEKVHRFHNVAATLAANTFVYQRRVYEMLAATIEELSKNLSKDLSNEESQVTTEHDHQNPSKRLNSLPTLFDCTSIFWAAEPPECELKDVLEVTEKKLAAAISDLQSVRSDNKVLVQRINACKEFRKYSRVERMPDVSHTPLFVHHILGEPHDRVVMWLLVKEQLAKVIAAYVTKETNQLQYAAEFRTLLCILKQRLEWIMYVTWDLLCECENSPALVPPALTGATPVYRWLIKYFFGYLISASQPLNSAFITKCISEQIDDFNDINMVIKEWIEEALVITRTLEMLLVVEPMFDVHEMEMLSHHDAIWSVMFSGSSIIHRTNNVRNRCAGALLNFEQPENYRLPHRSQTRNQAWDTKYLEAKNQLRETWEDYFDGLRDWVSQCKQIAMEKKIEVAALFEQIEDMTEPPTVVLPERKVHPGTPLASRVKYIESSSSDSIPHHYGPDTPTVRKVTKRKLANEARKKSEDEEKAIARRAALATEADVLIEGQDDAIIDDDNDADVEEEREEDEQEPDEDQAPIRIPVKSRYLSVVDSLFSNAQEQVANVRWPRFERFMKDAGCSVRYDNVAVTFSGHNIITGRRVSCVIHRPHPDSTLYAVHLRNNRLHIEAAFGWTEEMFVERRSAVETDGF